MSYNNNGGFEDVVKQLTNRGPQTVQQPLQPENIHTLLNASVEKIAQGWIDELAALRENTSRLESLLMAHVASTKANINRLHDLGAKIANEAARGREVCDQITEAVQLLNPPSA
jgi:hypothetical protein